jgi:hypothetical protein
MLQLVAGELDGLASVACLGAYGVECKSSLRAAQGRRLALATTKQRLKVCEDELRVCGLGHKVVGSHRERS